MEDSRKSPRGKPATLLSGGQRKIWKAGIALDAKYFLKCEQTFGERNLGSLEAELKKKKVANWGKQAEGKKKEKSVYWKMRVMNEVFSKQK